MYNPYRGSPCHPRGQQRGGYYPHNYQGTQYQPVPPPQHSQNPAPIQITLSVNPNQLSSTPQQQVPNDYYRPPHPSQYLHERPPVFDPPPPPYTKYFNSSYHHPTPQHGLYGNTAPPPYSPNEIRSPLLHNPAPYNKDNVMENYPPDLQSRSKAKGPKMPHSESRGRHAQGRGHSHNNNEKGMSRSTFDLSEGMPLGCEASVLQGNKKRSREKHGDHNNADNDDNSSVRSMPPRTREKDQNAVRGNRGARRGQRGAGRRGGSSKYCDFSNFGNEKDSASIQSMPLTPGFQRNEKRSKEKHGDHDNDDDISSIQSMPTGAGEKYKNAVRGNRGARRGQRGAGRRGHSTRGGSSKTGGSDFGNDEVEESDKASIQSIPLTSGFLRNKKRSKENYSGHDDCTVQSGPSGARGNRGMRRGQRGGGHSVRRRSSKTCDGSNFENEGLERGEKQSSEPKIKKLNVSLRIKSLFDDVDALKNTVREACVFPVNGKFEIEFTSETLLYKYNMSSCKFVLVTDNIWMAKKCVKNMLDILRKKLKTFVFFHYDVVINEHKKICGENVKNLKDDENVKGGDKEDKKEKVKKSSGSCEFIDEQPFQCPVTLQLSVEKPFAETVGFLSFVKMLINSSVEEFTLIEESISLSETKSECAINLRSKADAKRLKKVFVKFQKETKMKIECSVAKKDQDTEVNEAEMKIWNSEVEKVLTKMEKKKKDVLEKHDKKISYVRGQLEVKYGHTEEKDAIEDKLMEAIRQRIEFLCMCERLNNQIQELKTGKPNIHDLDKVQQAFGIECQRLVNALPIYARREDIISHIKANQVSIILGETGSGKSTQIAQYLYEAGYASEKAIVCTQPRKVAAVQLADRVAQEMTVRTGGLVGFKVGSKKKFKDESRIVFMTDHGLLNECLDDRNFNKYSCIIVDEAHERSIYTDILLGMIKICLQARKDLRVIITSATIDPEVFIDYFQCNKELRVSGRTYPVEVIYKDLTDDFENYEAKAVSKAVEIHKNEPMGDILVFLSSPVEIMRCCEEFCKIFKDRNDFQCLPLHGQLLPEEQKKVFAKLGEGIRKIVFSTNCAETSITIDGIKYVVDTGVAKELRYDPKKNISLLGVHITSQSSADQRKGRAGRTASGKCYRLFSEESYKAMAVTNEPEILRVHLGQAILKLAELGVNICDYDFVKAPSNTALLAALETLEYLGAIDDEKITDMGRWISKLPFDPKLGYLVFEAGKENLLYDGIVLASVVSNGSGLFYRGLTETEAQISARSKSQFGVESGDIFTWYTIYQLWEALPRGEKYKWCRTNCINYKCLNFVKQCVEDVIGVMSNDMRMTVDKQFSNEDFAINNLSKLVFRANARSLSHFLGHSRAGYFSLLSERQVHLHPSCTLAAQNLQPEWLVFTEQIKTSREFIKGVMVVDEEWIHEAVRAQLLNVDIAQAKQQRLSLVHLEELGSSVFRAVVGPRFSNLQVLEDISEKFGMQHTIIEADKDLGTLAVYSSSQIHPEVVNQLEEMKAATIKKLKTEETECCIFNEKLNDSPNIRALLGNGACVKQVLMPNQTKEVLIRKVGDGTEEEIVTKFGEFGNILDVIHFKSPEPWGFLRYESIADAATAVERTKNDETMTGSLRLGKGSNSKNTKNMFEAKVTWLRRPVKGGGTGFIQCSPMDKPALIGHVIPINGGLHKIQLSNKERERRDQEGKTEQDLILHKIGNATEEQIRHEIQVLTGKNIEMKIFIPRDRVPAPGPEKLKEIKQSLRTFIDPENNFKEEELVVWIKKPREEAIYQLAFINFSDPVRGLRICRSLNGCLGIEGQIVNIAPCLKTMILVPKRIKEACKEQMDDLFTSMERDIGVEFEWKKLRDDHAITIKSKSPDGIVKARECINNELKGDVIDCNVVSSCQCLLTKAGQQHLKEIQIGTGCVIVSDLRTKKIHLYGKSDKVSHAMIEINSCLADNDSKKEQLFRLKGLGKPPGLMKELMKKFGPLLGGLSKEYHLASVSIDWRTHTLLCAGSEIDIDLLEKYLSTLEDDLCLAKLGKEKTSNLPECAVCLDSVVSKELYRLEACGHAYCWHCLQHQAVVCVQSNQFPLVCTEEQCGTDLVWRDIRFILMKKWIGEAKLVNSSLNSCVSLQPDKYKFCPTPNCPVVYEVTDSENGCEFNCAACFASTCSSCHVAFHAGASCEMAKSANKAENTLKQWCSIDPDKRKICPGCKSPVEKIEGCNKMLCSSCRTVFCWVCCKMFENSQLCYAHLAKAHGGMY